MIASTPAGIILAWNHGAECIFGYSVSDVIGKHVSMLMAPERLNGRLRDAIKMSESALTDDKRRNDAS